MSDGRKVVFRQPRRWDTHEQKRALRKIGDANWERYRRPLVEEQWLYNMNQRCKAPPYRGETPGVLPLTIEVESEAVGFCDIFFKYGVDFPRFLVEPEDKCANGSIIVADKYQGMGLGYMYSEMSDYIARHYGCKWILGRTYRVGGMRSIRSKDDWEIIRVDGDYVEHRKLL